MSEHSIDNISTLPPGRCKVESLNVNSGANFGDEVNIKLSRQIRQILFFFFQDVNHIYHQVDIIKAVYGAVTPSRKASFSRSIKTLIKAGLVESSKAYYSDNLQAWIVRRVCYCLTEKGERFVKGLREVSP